MFHNEMKEVKAEYTAKDLCQPEYNSEDLSQFVDECLSYKFSQKPHYKKLKLLLLSALSKYDEETA